ncbi:TPA: Dot/Icm T4SS effector MavC [Legionella pneumophila]|nr:Dot/Icm T4SS effector MavC [Legionella pneumophila]
MTTSKLEKTGLHVHEKIKHMVKSYGTMITGIPAEILGQNEAEISVGYVKKMGNMKENIAEVVRKSEMTQPTNSCGKASNEVCDLLLGTEGASEFEKSNYQVLSGDGINLKGSLPNKNLLVRVEMDRFNAPQKYQKIKREEFNPETAEKNKIYLLEDQLVYLDIFGKVIDLGQTSDTCHRLFNAITTPFYQNYILYDEYIDPKESAEEAAMFEMGEIVTAKMKNIDCWTATHSFTIFIPEAESEETRTLYPYQAYWTSHTLQQWFSGDKDEKLSRLGIDGYIEKLALLGTTTDSKIRSSIYGELFSPPGKEHVFCTGINEKFSPLRVKFKVTEVNPEIALQNLQEVQEFIDTNYPGENPKAQCELYKTKAQEAMTKQLEMRLLTEPTHRKESVPPYKEKNTQSFFSKNLDTTSRIDKMISSVITMENLKILAKEADTLSGNDREKLVEYFKTLPSEQLAEIKPESETAQKAWDEQYGLVLRGK